MSLPCPYHNVSYATWRLRILRQLCQSSHAQSSRHQRTLHDPPTRQTRRRNYSDFRPFNVGGSTKRATAQDSSSAEPPRAAQSPRNGSSREQSFSPYSDAGRQALKSLLSELKTAGKKLQQKAEDEKHVSSEHKVSVPKSPVIGRVEDAAKRRTTTKERPTRQELGPLGNNPWAEILASPIRACQGSTAKLPVDLLLDLGYVTNPQDGKTYLLPAQLADLEALEAKMAKQLHKEEKRRIYHEKQAAREDLAAEAETTPPSGSNIKPLPPRAPTISRLFSNINFMRLMTRELTHVKGTTTRTKPGQVLRLLTFDSKEAIGLAQHYWRHHRDVEYATGPGDSSSQTEMLDFQLKDLQWQSDLHSRLVWIMQKRVLTALKALAVSTAKYSPAGGASPRCAAVPIPEGGKFNSDVLKHVISSGSTWTRQSGDRDATLPDSISGSAVQRPDYHLLGHSEWLPGTIFLHVGSSDVSSRFPRSSPTSSDQVSESPSASSLPPVPSNPLIPPMISVDDTYRFPVLSLPRLFSHQGHRRNGTGDDLHELNALISQTPILQNPTPGADDYLVLVRPGAGPPKAVIKEVWALWRYLGGENMHPSLLESVWASEGGGGFADDRDSLASPRSEEADGEEQPGAKRWKQKVNE